MVLISRYLSASIKEDLGDRKMVFLGGPRQVGKTTLSLSFLDQGTEAHPAYLNWDDPQDRARIRSEDFPEEEPLLVFDEVHKLKTWRRILKGAYDKRKNRTQFIVTGSARLDYYAKGGDSLLGRYRYYRLHPFSLNELVGKGANCKDVERLLKFGGFPEPLFKESERTLRRWHNERLHRLIQDDVRDLETVKDLSSMELLAHSLTSKVGAPLSVKALAEDLMCSFATAERWLQILERMYYCFRIPPLGAPKVKAVKKEQKLYLWDWSELQAPGTRFENMVACQLLKHCHFLQDTEGYRMELRFLRDVEKREVDFVVLKNGKPDFAIEVKTGEKPATAALHYFRERTNIPRFYQVHMGKLDTGSATHGVRIIPFHKLVEELSLP